MSEAKEDLQQAVSRQQRSMWAAAGGVRSSREEKEQRRQAGIDS